MASEKSAIIEVTKNQAYKMESGNLTATVFIAGVYDDHLDQTGFKYVVQFGNQAGTLKTEIEGDSLFYLTVASERLAKDFQALVNEAIDHFCNMPYVGWNMNSIRDSFYVA